MSAIIVTTVFVLLLLAFIRFIVLNRDGLLRTHRAYGDILELVDHEWERGLDIIRKIERKFGPDRFSDCQIYDFLDLLVKDRKIEKQQRLQAVTRPDGKEYSLRILEFRKLPAPSENAP